MKFTDAQLIELAKKYIGQEEKAKIRGKAIAKTLQRLKIAHRDEYDRYLAEELKSIEKSQE